eukprot:267031-Rhodomonas_salina.1
MRFLVCGFGAQRRWLVSPAKGGFAAAVGKSFDLALRKALIRAAFGRSLDMLHTTVMEMMEVRIQKRLQRMPKSSTRNRTELVKKPHPWYWTCGFLPGILM